MSLIVVNKSGGTKPPPGTQAAGPTPPMAVHAQPPTSIVGPPIVTTAINLSVSANHLSAPYAPVSGKKPTLAHAHPNGSLGHSYPVSAAPMVVSKKMIHGPVTTHLPISARPLPHAAHQTRHLPAGTIVTSTSHGLTHSQHLPHVAAAHLASPATILTTSGGSGETQQHLVQHHPPPVGHLTPLDPRLRMIQMPQHPALPQSPVRPSALSLTAHPSQSLGQSRGQPRFTMPQSPIQLPQTPYNLNAHPLSQGQVSVSHRLAPHAHRGPPGKVVLSSNATASMLPKTPHPAMYQPPPHTTAMHLPSSAVNLIPQAQLTRTNMLPQPPSNLQPPPPSKILPPNLPHYQLFGGHNSRKRNNSEE